MSKSTGLVVILLIGLLALPSGGCSGGDSSYLASPAARLDGVGLLGGGDGGDATLLNPSSGVFIDGRDGDFRGRTENIFDNPLGSVLQGAALDDSGSETPPTRPKKTWKRSSLVPNTTRLKVGDKQTLAIKGTQVTVEIDGFRARVLLDLHYFNDHDEQLHGSFSVRMPQGATPYYLAFGKTAVSSPTFHEPTGTTPDAIRARPTSPDDDVKEARIVPKVKAAHAFAAVVREKIDPALLEWAGAGVFTASVYPLTPKSLHRITFGYEVNLLSVGEDLIFQLDLPKRTGTLDVDISARGVDAEVRPSQTAAEGHWHWRNPKQRVFGVRIKAPGNVALTGTHSGGRPYFAARIKPALPSAASTPAPRGVFLVDTSLSSNPQAFRIWLQLLQGVLAKNRGTLKEFAVVFFGIDTLLWEDGFVANTAENAARVSTFANTLALEGATDVARALRAAQALGEGSDVFLMSDGSATWGESDLHAMSRALPKGSPLFAYSTGLGGTDLRALRHLTQASKGAVFAVTSPDDVANAATAHTRRPWQIESVSIAGGTDLLLAGRPTALYPGQAIVVAGRGSPQTSAPLVLRVSRDGEQREVQTAFDRTVSSAMGARLYGQIAVGQLESLGHFTTDTTRAYATHFRVVGPTCSLLMLESEADYQRFAIKPEADAYVVGRTPADAVVRAAVSKAGDSLRNPRARLLQTLAELEKTPGVKFQVPAGLKVALQQMPIESLQPPVSSLFRNARTWSAMPKPIRRDLAKRKFKYDTLLKEAGRRQTRHGPADALQALSTLVEHQPGDYALARDVGYAAMTLNLHADAFGLFQRVSRARPYEPQSYHAMAQCLVSLGYNDLALTYYEIALAGTWPPRVGAFRRIVAVDYLHFLRQIESGQRKASVPAFAKERQPAISAEAGIAEADLVVVIAWSTDRTDVDLHVTDPAGEVCFYSHPETKMGGKITADVTAGFGPEMFVLPKAKDGRYLIQAKYFSSDTTRLGTRTKVYATIYQDWGRPTERVAKRSVLLARGQQMHNVLSLHRREGAFVALGGAPKKSGAFLRR